MQKSCIFISYQQIKTCEVQQKKNMDTVRVLWNVSSHPSTFLQRLFLTVETFNCHYNYTFTPKNQFDSLKAWGKPPACPRGSNSDSLQATGKRICSLSLLRKHKNYQNDTHTFSHTHLHKSTHAKMLSLLLKLLRLFSWKEKRII